MSTTVGTNSDTKCRIKWPAQAQLLPVLPNWPLLNGLPLKVWTITTLERPLWSIRPNSLAKSRSIPNPGTVTDRTDTTTLTRVTIVMVTAYVSEMSPLTVTTRLLAVKTGVQYSTWTFTATSRRTRRMLPAACATKDVAEKPLNLAPEKSLIPVKILSST